MRICFFMCMWIGCICTVDAQDTVVLPTVEIQANAYQKYMIGTKNQSFDSTWLARHQGQLLADLLMSQSGAYLKQYGNGMLSSISLRGTGAGHTAVLWNGININSFTLGESDFSVLPIFANQHITLQYGSSSALWGSDAIGGSILIQSQEPTFQSSSSLGLQQSIGSFGNIQSQASFQKSSNKWFSHTNLYRQSLTNDFASTQEQRNASLLNYGLNQRLAYQINTQKILTADAWYHFSDRNLQGFGATQKEDNLRLLLGYHHYMKNGLWQVQAGYVADNMLYNKTQNTNIKRAIANTTFETELGKQFTFKAGTNVNYIWTDVDAYNERQQQIRTDIYALTHWQITPSVQSSLHLRQSFVSGFDAPFAPSLGLAWQLVNTSQHTLTLKSSASKSYRVPNLNAMFWQPGGNPNIQPETALNWEVGTNYSFKNKLQHTQTELTFYRMSVQDWILWKAEANYWTPSNVRQVEVTGLEWQGSTKWKISPQTNAALRLDYAYTKSTNVAGEENNPESIDKQLPYVPFNRLAATLMIDVKGFWLSNNVQYTDVRFITTDNSQHLDGFALYNVQIGKNIPLKQHQFSLMLNINNALNTSYINVGRQEMPPRNYIATLRYQFN